VDLGSANGTRINGELIAGPSPLRDGDRLTLADVELGFRAAAIVILSLIALFVTWGGFRLVGALPGVDRNTTFPQFPEHGRLAQPGRDLPADPPVPAGQRGEAPGHPRDPPKPPQAGPGYAGAARRGR
jgi:hypothetical protein